MGNYLEDDKGNKSSTRLIWIIGMLTVLVVWAYNSTIGSWVDGLPEGFITFFGLILALKPGTKAIENFKPKG